MPGSVSFAEAAGLVISAGTAHEDLVEARTLRPQVEAVLPLDQTREALRRVAGRHVRGKVVRQVEQ